MKKSALRKQLRSMRKKLRRPPVAEPKLRVVGSRISEISLARARVKTRKNLDEADVFKPYAPAPGVLPAGTRPIAMDSSQTTAAVAWAQSAISSYWQEGLTFMGYPELAALTVRPEYRVISEVIATECTRKWITFQATDEEDAADEGVLEASEELPEEHKTGEGEEADVAEDADPMVDQFAEMQAAKAEKEEAKNQLAKERAAGLAEKDGKADRIKELTKEFDRLCVRDLFAKIVQFDGFFGRVHLYIDTGQGDDRVELMTDLGDGSDDVTKAKFKKGSLERLAVIEPVWTYPQNYNANDPLSPDWYSPSQWFVMSKQLHASRLLTFVGRPVPDILKPAYAFGGLSLSQIAKPYVNNWLQTRQSVNDIIKAFSVMVLMTDLSSTMSASEGEGSEGLYRRLDLFNLLRDNRGVFAIDKEGEDFKNVTAQLANLDSLQAQSQEHMAAVSRIPLVKLLGISPHGLNASSEGELRAFYDTINSYQEFALRPNLTRVMHFAMMNLWGEVDEDITFKFEPLWAMTEKEEAEVRKIDAETDDIYVNGVAAIHPEEVRKKLASQPDSAYEGIDVADVPDAPVDEGALNLMGHEQFGKGAQGEGEEAGLKNDNPFGQAEDAAGWNESDHPRVKGGEHAGEFTAGGGGAFGKKGGPGHRAEFSSSEEALGKLTPLARTEAGAEKVFHSGLRTIDAWEKRYGNKKGVEFYHEVPGNAAESIKKEGIRSEYGVFASIGEPSQFVTSPEKTIVKFVVPRDRLNDVGPDMAYTPAEEEGLGPHQILMLSSGAHFKGAYVSLPDAVPPEWITGVEVKKEKS